jgi:hypothetical protein
MLQEGHWLSTAFELIAGRSQAVLLRQTLGRAEQMLQARKLETQVRGARRADSPRRMVRQAVESAIC